MRSQVLFSLIYPMLFTLYQLLFIESSKKKKDICLGSSNPFILIGSDSLQFLYRYWYQPIPSTKMMIMEPAEDGGPLDHQLCHGFVCFEMFFCFFESGSWWSINQVGCQLMSQLSYQSSLSSYVPFSSSSSTHESSHGWVGWCWFCCEKLNQF